MFSMVICDDEQPFIDQLKSLLERYEKESGRSFTYHIFRDGSELLANYQPEYDLIFMDIRMEKLDGLKTAEALRQMDGAVGLMFVTSLPQYVWKGYEFGAFNYLLKPLKYGRLRLELDRFFAHYQGREEPYLSFANDSGKYKVKYKSLRYAETARRNVLLHFDGQEQVIHKNMKWVSARLEARPQFCRCHASFIVNLAYVKSVENMEALLTTGERVPISQPKRKEFMEQLAGYWGDLV